MVRFPFNTTVSFSHLEMSSMNVSPIGEGGVPEKSLVDEGVKNERDRRRDITRPRTTAFDGVLPRKQTDRSASISLSPHDVLFSTLTLFVICFLARFSMYPPHFPFLDYEDMENSKITIPYVRQFAIGSASSLTNT